MRRPLKPFVTEYKGSSRRQKEAGGPEQTFNTEARSIGGKRSASAFDAKPFEAPLQDAKSRPTQSSPRADMRFNPASNEDSYEAALRAADALFAPMNNTAKPLQPDWTEAEQASRDISQSSRAPGDFAENGKMPPSGSGRILRSLEEPQAPSFAHLEEALPKRRGRKPGSKNKPKTSVRDDAPGTPMPTARPTEVARTFQYAISACEPLAGAPSLASGARGAITALPPLPKRRATRPPRERFAWVRTRLAPGERWKRRLPKVIW